jgi:hypothetical protein
MAGQVTFALDDAEFQTAMRDYIQVSSKDGAFAMNRTMNNLAVFGFQEAKQAQAGEIERVQTLDWWPKYVAASMVRRKAKQLSVRMEKASRKGRVIGGKMYQRLAMLHYTRAEARKESERIIRKRSLAIGFVRFFFATLSRSMRAVTPGLMTPPSKTFRGFDVTVKPATMDNPSVTARVAYAYRSRGERAVKKAEALLQGILDRARPLLIADMREYIKRKASENARRISA